MCRTSSALDCQLCQLPGCNMVCGTAATEAITAISKATATQFQMQRSINCSMPPPFPTVLESASLKQAYKMASTRSYPTTPALNTLAQQMGVETKDVKSWLAQERKAKGQAVPSTATRTGSGSTTPRERSSFVKIRARLPLTTRGSRQSAS